MKFEPLNTGFQKNMSPYSADWWSKWSDALAVSGLILGTIVALVAIAGWIFSWKASKLKDAAFDEFKYSAEASIAEANREAAIANQKAEKLKNDLIERQIELELIKQKISWRTISQEDKEIFVREMKTLEKVKINLAFFPNDPECRKYAEELALVLHSAGFEINSFQQVIRIDGLVMGIEISSREFDDPLAQKFIQTFQMIGVHPSTKTHSKGDANISIYVGSRNTDI